MNILALPEELVVEIAEWLPVKDLANAMRVNRKLYRICRDDRLWSRHREFPYRLSSGVNHGLGNGKSLRSSFGSWFAAIKRESKPPPPRLCHVGVVFGDSMYISGGHTTVPNTQLFSTVMSDLWKIDLVTRRWVELHEPGLPMRTEHSAVVWGSKMWLFGGFGGLRFTSELLCYDFKTNELTTVVGQGDAPSPRSAHVAVAYEGKMWVFAGWNGFVSNAELHSFDFETREWAQVSVKGPSPSARCSHAAALAPDAKSFFVYGGNGGQTTYFSDLWQFSFETMTWSEVGRLDQPGSRMRMVEYRNKLFILGGWNSKEHFNSFNEFDIATRTWRALRLPFGPDRGRMGQFSMCTFNHKMFQFGGYNEEVNCATADLHVYRIGRPDFPEGSISAH